MLKPQKRANENQVFVKVVDGSLVFEGRLMGEEGVSISPNGDMVIEIEMLSQTTIELIAADSKLTFSGCTLVPQMRPDGSKPVAAGFSVSFTSETITISDTYLGPEVLGLFKYEIYYRYTKSNVESPTRKWDPEIVNRGGIGSARGQRRSKTTRAVPSILRG